MNQPHPGSIVIMSIIPDSPSKFLLVLSSHNASLCPPPKLKLGASTQRPASHSAAHFNDASGSAHQVQEMEHADGARTSGYSQWRINCRMGVLQIRGRAELKGEQQAPRAAAIRQCWRYDEGDRPALSLSQQEADEGDRQ